jgi:hypothetical protein
MTYALWFWLIVVTLIAIVIIIGALRKKPGYRRKKADPSYCGPERRTSPKNIK